MPPQFCQFAPTSDGSGLLRPPLILNAEIAERLAQRVERAMSQNKRYDIASTEPQKEQAKGKAPSACHKRAMPALVVSVAIAEEG